MSTFTPNFNLEKPDSTDDFKDFRSNYNSNMDIIDANLGGGGGGNVDDVLVNGVSVVDGNHDAQITSYKEVTQAEYNALPSSKLTDGIAYFIKDLDNASVEGYPPLIYSDEEREVGVWRDGKPLYQKTLVNNSTNASGSNTLIDVSALDIDTCVSINGICDRIVPNTGTLIYDMNSWETNQLYTCLSHSKFSGNIQYQIRFYNNEGTSWQVITIQYTKTTDTAGSGIWNGQGGLAHHYSTTEQVIGTWIDTKPVYECTFYLASASLSSKEFSISTGLSNIKKILTCTGVLTNGSETYTLPFERLTERESIRTFARANSDGTVTLNVITGVGGASGYSTVTDVYVTITYTKTTD